MNKENGIIINGKKYVATAGSSCEKCAFGHGKYQYCNSFCVAFAQDLLGLNEEVIFKEASFKMIDYGIAPFERDIRELTKKGINEQRIKVVGNIHDNQKR